MYYLSQYLPHDLWFQVMGVRVFSRFQLRSEHQHSYGLPLIPIWVINCNSFLLTILHSFAICSNFVLSPCINSVAFLLPRSGERDLLIPLYLKPQQEIITFFFFCFVCLLIFLLLLFSCRHSLSQFCQAQISMLVSFGAASLSCLITHPPWLSLPCSDLGTSVMLKYSALCLSCCYY